MVERRFPREIGSLEAIVSFVRDFLGERGLDRDSVSEVELVAEELFTNVVKYGRGGGAEVALSLEWSDSTWTLRLEDFDVEPFDVTAVAAPDVDAPLSERRRGGLGIHLVRRIADRFDYQHQRGRSVLTVSKKVG